MKFKVGDRVKVRKDLIKGKHYGKWDFCPFMEEWKNKTMTIIDVHSDCYIVKENNWAWTDEMLEEVSYTYEDLKKSPIGTKITFENKTVLLKLHHNYYRECSEMGYYRNEKDLRSLKDNLSGTLGKIIKIEEPEYKTVYESKVEILDEAEKRYLRGVIRPFRDKVTYIKKFIYSTGNAKIDINVENWYICLPTFPKNQMYKNMEDDKEYTLEELGL